MLKEMLLERNVPQLLPGEQMLEMLHREVFGYLPPEPESVTFEDMGKRYPRFCSGDAECRKILAHCVISGKEFSFPFYATLPTDGEKHPFFVHANFSANVPDRYQPTEELVDNGFAVLSFHYEDVTNDKDDFTDGLAGVLYEDGQRGDTDPGKIAMWAWAAQRLMDYAETREDVLDLSCAVVCGHSRLGKTALLAAATDPRFTFCYSNDSGCSGAALSRGKVGEDVDFIVHRFPYWFCKDYWKYGKNEQNMPFDQHFLVASIAPRPVLVGSATDDQWADPVSELLCCVAAAPAFPGGFSHPDRLPEAGEGWLEGGIGYHLRKGDHYFSRRDWQQLIRFVKLHWEK